YPEGDKNRYYSYTGKGGIELDSFFKKLVMAFYYKDIKILFSGDIRDDSRIMIQRDIQDRILKIAPFLYLDEDPYIVINEGKLFWIQDAYTVTGKYPYSEKYGNINYIRNSVKIVVDAYQGDVDFYISDNEPIINTYSKVFEGMFKSVDMMPEGLKDNIRYPEDLFKIQSEIYATYHMTDPVVFYNKEDAWQIPYEIYGVGQKIKAEPYYVIMKLPGNQEEEFMLMTSFTPIRKDNMISWFAARSDKNYGQLVLYKFPKDTLISGPFQIEAKFDQDSTISEQITLWSQQGSQVSRGNLLVIPIRDSILYVEPLYIQAEKGQLPQLKRVLVSDGENVVMEEDLKTALSKLLGSDYADKSEDEFEDLLDKAGLYYDNILDAMNNGDWNEFGNNFDKLGNVIGLLKNKDKDTVLSGSIIE
ncbi:MAG: UPF0182 family protein, partial [Nanoarchaeota archaeon]